ncbi:MAG: polyprenyl synthetase family protein [Lachnospirales bacterium]
MDRLEDNTKLINCELEKILTIESPTNIIEAMRYGVFPGGKRIRPNIALGIMEGLGGEIKYILPFACSLELIHSYSLIHDDLPALDNDDMRRGKATNHRVYGESTAILVGDALLNLAFENMLNHTHNLDTVNVCKEIANASGVSGMIGGQEMDMKLDVRKGSNETLKEDLAYVHTNKTGKLFRSAFAIAPILLGKKDVKNKLAKVGLDYGLSFQILDDILEYESTSEVLGKSVESDVNNNKTTYVSLYGMDESKKIYNELVNRILCEVKDVFTTDTYIYKLIESTFSRIN